jgi:hypothetical protein
MALNINGTTGISGVDASVSAPALTGTDSNTGISFPSADTIKFSTGGVERMSITNSGVTGVSGGKILQFVSVDITSTTSWATTSFVDISGLTATINGVSSGSKIIVDFNLVLGRSHDTHYFFKLFRDSTFLPAYSGASLTFNHYPYISSPTYEFISTNFRFVDTHGQSAGANITYKLQGANEGSSNYAQYLNRRNYNSTQRGSSLMTLMEVSA